MVRTVSILKCPNGKKCSRFYYDQAVANGVPVVSYRSDFDFTHFGSILDRILGTGFSGKLKGNKTEVIEKINSSGAYIVSADINSGLNGDTGTGELYVVSNLTVSIGDFKYGHFIGDADKAMKACFEYDASYNNDNQGMS